MDIVTNPISDSVSSLPKTGGGPVVQWHYEGTERAYGVQLNWQSPGVEKSMYYDVLMRCPKLKDEDGVWEVTKTNFYTDNKIPEDTIELLAVACAQSFYPFEFTASKSGGLTSLFNVDKIRKRFSANRPVLDRNFGGEVSSAYISATEMALNNPQQLKSIITADAWFAMFFAEVTGSYNPDKTKQIAINFPFFGFEEDLLFNGTIAIGKPDVERKAQALVVSAMLDSFPVINGESLLSGRMEATYDIDIPGHYIRNINGQITVKTTGGDHHVWLNGYRIDTIDIKLAQPLEEKPKPGGWRTIFSD